MPVITVSLSGSGIVNGSRSYNISDAHLQKLLDWAANNCPKVPIGNTNQQILLGWIQSMLIDRTVNRIHTPAITITPS